MPEKLFYQQQQQQQTNLNHSNECLINLPLCLLNYKTRNDFKPITNRVSLL